MSGLTQCAVWLYGSHARGDADAESDWDVFVASDEGVSLDGIQVQPWLAYSTGSVSRYSWPEVEGMAAYGSLFLEHLRLEGLPVYESPQEKGKLAAILSRMSGYQLADRDLRGFRAVLNDVAQSLAFGGSEIFELSVLGTVIRHSSILGCWLLGRPSFGRIEPVARLVSVVGLAKCISDGFPELYRFRLYVEGRLQRKALPPTCEALAWLKRAGEVVTCVEVLKNARR